MGINFQKKTQALLRACLVCVNSKYLYFFLRQEIKDESSKLLLFMGKKREHRDKT